MNKIIYYLKQVIQISIFNKKAITEIANDKSATKYAFIFFAISYILEILYIVFQSVFNPYVFGVMAFFVLLLVVISLFSTQMFAKIFKSKTPLICYFRAISLVDLITTVLMFVNLIPVVGKYLGLALIIYSLIITVFVLKNVYDFSVSKSFFITIVSTIITIVGSAIITLSLIILIVIVLVLFGVKVTPEMFYS